MAKLLALWCIAVLGAYAGQTPAKEKQALRLVRTIPLAGLSGRLDHMGADLQKKRLFVASSMSSLSSTALRTAG
jgi:hypothetical protein